MIQLILFICGFSKKKIDIYFDYIFQEIKSCIFQVNLVSSKIGFSLFAQKSNGKLCNAVNEPKVMSTSLLQDLSAVGQLVMVTLFSNWKSLVGLTLKSPSLMISC